MLLFEKQVIPRKCLKKEPTSDTNDLFHVLYLHPNARSLAWIKMDELKTGIYDHLISDKLRQALDSLDPLIDQAIFGKLEEPLATDYLTRFLRARINQALAIVKHDQRLDLANRLIHSLAEFDDNLTFLNSEKLESIAEILDEISPAGRPRFLQPTTSPSSPSLFTGTGTSPQLGREIELELESADRVDMLVSFIKSAGLKLLLPALKSFTDRPRTKTPLPIPLLRHQRWGFGVSPRILTFPLFYEAF